MAQDGGIFDVEVLQKVLCDPSNGIITTPPPTVYVFYYLSYLFCG